MEIVEATNANSGSPEANFSGIYNFGDFLSLPLERPKPAIAGLLYEGQTGMLAGRFAVGKTLIATQMTIHLSCGVPFLGRTIDHAYKVGFVDCENGPAEIQGRLQAQLDSLKLTDDEVAMVKANCFYVNARDVGSSLYGFQFEKRQTSKCEEFLNDCKPEIVMIDNLGRVLPGDLEKTEDVTEFFKTVQGIKERCPSVKTMIFLHHIKKPSDHNGGEKCSLYSAPYEYLTQMRGSGRLLDFSEMRFALAEERFGNEKYHVLNGLARSTQVEPILLEKNEDTLSFQIVADKSLLIECLFTKKPAQKAVFDAVQAQRSKHFRFADLLKLKDPEGKLFNRGTLSETLRLMTSNGLLSKEPDGSYAVPETLY